MPDDLIGQDYALSGVTLYAVIRDEASLWWNGTAFEAYTEANWTSYAVTLSEQGTSHRYKAATPALPAGTYSVGIRQRAGASPATSDLPVGGFSGYWDGTEWHADSHLDAAFSGLPAAVWANGTRTLTAFGFSVTTADPWLTPLPGSYSAGTAGKILGDLLTTLFGTAIHGGTLLKLLQVLGSVLGGDQTDTPDGTESTFDAFMQPGTPLVTSVNTDTTRTVTIL